MADLEASRLRVVAPMLNLVVGGMGGTESYVRHLLPHLSARPGLDVSTAVPASASGHQRDMREIVVRHVPGGASSAGRLLSQLAAAIPTADLRHAMDSAHVVHYPLSVRVPRPPRGKPYVVTLHDTQHHDLPELFTRAERAYRTFAYDRPAQRADAVVTISEFSRQQIVRHLAIPAARVHVAPLGVDTTGFHPSSTPREDFVLYPARGWPHKNHRRLVQAMEIVRRRRPGLRLVLTGGDLDRLGTLPEWVDRPGLVPAGVLRDLYRRAACVAFPSRYEGFGLPPLEAMASGCPVAVARAASLPEVCGEAAVYFDPEDPEAMASAILETGRRHVELSELGLARSRQLTWAACAAAHEDAFRSAVRSRG